MITIEGLRRRFPNSSRSHNHNYLGFHVLSCKSPCFSLPHSYNINIEKENFMHSKGFGKVLLPVLLVQPAAVAGAVYTSS